MVRVAILSVLIFFSIAANAQPGDPGGDPGENPVPISGIEILLGAGALFGAKKFLQNRKNK